MTERRPASALRYALPARWLHWTVAAIVPVQLWLGWAADRALERDERSRLIHVHFQLGLIILTLMVLRVAWRLLRGSPSPLPESAWRLRAALMAHVLLYVLLLLLPASGYVIWVWMGAPMDLLGFFEIPRLFIPPNDDERGRAWAWYVHHYAAIALSALALLHVAAALWRQFARRDGIISRRML